MIEDPQRLERLIDSWSESSAPRLAATAGGSDRPEDASVRALHDVARIAEFNRSLQRAGTTVPMPERWGQLLLLEHVRSGAHADVYRAWEPALQREVALKLLRTPGAVAASWMDEARAIARIHHPHIVTVFGAAEHDGRGGVWMEYVRGETLAEAIERAGPLPANEVARIGRQLGDALTALHAGGLVHGDVKPANVILDPAGRAVLTDFGLGRRWTAESRGAFSVSGTPLFLSPERLDSGAATPKSDQYALGVTLWFALTGRYPYDVTTFEELRAATAAGRRATVRAQRNNAPPPMAAAIEQATHPDPNARHASVDALAAAMAAPRGGQAAGANRRTMVLVGLIVVGAIAWGLGMRIPRGQRGADPAPPLTSPPAEAPAANYEATFVRRTAGGYDRLVSGDRVRPGDDISLEFRSSRTTWIYVLNQDERGATFLLFPQPRFDRTNPLAADTTLILPGPVAGRENAWEVTSRGGREHLLVVAHTAPIPELEAELGRLPAPRPDQRVEYARISPTTTEWLRGIGGVAKVSPAPRRPPTTAGTFDRFQALTGRDTGVHGIWVRSVVFENPER